MKIALFHNIDGGGGAKRVVYEEVKGLAARGHICDLFVPASACETYLPIAPFCRAVKIYGEGIVAGAGATAAGGGHSSFGGEQGSLRKQARRLLGETGYLALRDTTWVRAQERRIGAFAHLYAQMALDIQAGDYDLLYGHQCNVMMAPDLLPLIRGAKRRLPIAFYIHDTLRRFEEWSTEPAVDYDARQDSRLRPKWRGRALSSAMMGWMRRENERFVRNLRAADRVLVNSLYSREGILRTTGLNARVGYPGVDGEYFSPSPDALLPRENEVLSVGALRREKRHELVIDAVATLPTESRPRVRIVGYELPGAELLGVSLCERAQRQGVDLVIDREVPHEALRDAYRRAKVLAFTPYLEPFGLVPLEAMACETPVVSVAEAGPRETMKDGITGYLAEPEPAAFGAALGRLFGDEGRRVQMGRMAREWVLAEWNWERAVDKRERQLQETIREVTGCG